MLLDSPVYLKLLTPSCRRVLLQALQSLSLADSRLRQRGSVLVNALGSNACLRKVDLSGNLLEDAGAKMLSKALQINTTLRCVCVVHRQLEEEERSWQIRAHHLKQSRSRVRGQMKE